MTDGSIQGMSARMKWPGYYNGMPNGVWNMPPEQLVETVQAYHAAGAHLHMHVNGDEASELMLDALEAALTSHPRRDHRHTLQHCQMADEAQFRRMAALGVCANLFANHIYYWGDQHREITMGPDRAMRMDACATAERLGVRFAIHSDAPVTPLGPLFTAWCAVNRLTASGKVLAWDIATGDAIQDVPQTTVAPLRLADGREVQIERAEVLLVDRRGEAEARKQGLERLADACRFHEVATRECHGALR